MSFPDFQRLEKNVFFPSAHFKIPVATNARNYTFGLPLSLNVKGRYASGRPITNLETPVLRREKALFMICIPDLFLKSHFACR